MDFNEYLAMKLVKIRIAEAIAVAERARLLASAPAQPARYRVGLGSLLMRVGRWLAGGAAGETRAQSPGRS